MNKDKVRKLIIDELDLHPQHPFWDKFEASQPTVSNEEVDDKYKQLLDEIDICRAITLLSSQTIGFFHNKTKQIIEEETNEINQ